MPDIFVAPNKQDGKSENTPLEKEANKPDETQNIDEESSEDSSSIHLFSSLCKNPRDVSFQNQEEGEKVLLFIRRANITNLKWLIIGTFFYLSLFSSF